MAKQTKTVSMEESLWQSCNKLRGSIEPSEYKHVVLSLMFLKYAGDHFEQRRNEIIAEGKGKGEFYTLRASSTSSPK